MTDAPPDQPLGERISRLEGVVEAEDKAFERTTESTKHVQVMIIALVGLVVAGSIAMLVYLLQRLDALEAMAAHK